MLKGIGPPYIQLFKIIILYKFGLINLLFIVFITFYVCKLLTKIT